jgi:DNA-binding CsgD family transcriptional regulator
VALTSQVQVHGRSGRWYTVRASLTEPDETGAASIVVVIDEARPADTAVILSRLYGMTKREREVVAMAAKGASTKEIGRRLGLSTYTVQEYLGNAYAKVGVRSRRELLAKLYFDGYANGAAH